VAIVYISHKLEELLRVGDLITVMRDGRIVGHAEAADVDVAWIIEQMVGRSPASLFSRTDHDVGETLMEVKHVTLPRVGGGYLLDDVSLQVHAGEILGLYGLMGAGRTELMEVLAGVRPEAKGEVLLDGRDLMGASVSDRIDAGVVLVPEDRKTVGLVPTLSVAHNMVLSSLRRYLSSFFLSRGKEKVAVDGMIRDLAVRVADPRNNIDSLSGGNQQKVVVAKGLLTEPRVLLLDEPTRGIDVGAKSEIFQIMSRLAGEGFGIVFVSSELKEVMAMSDRILVLSKGKIVAEFEGDKATEKELVDASAAGHGPATKPGGERMTAEVIQ
jgi:erythritol transport system ATP-binding protein